MKIAYLSLNGIDSPKHASGTPYFIAQALGQGFGQVVDISPKIATYNNKSSFARYDKTYLLLRMLAKIGIAKAPRFITRKGLRRQWQKHINEQIDYHNPDYIYADKSSALIPLINSSTPIIYRSDATAALMNHYYPEFQASSRSEKAFANQNEVISLQKSDFFIPLSHWAAQSAQTHYNKPTSQIQVVRSHSSLCREKLGTRKSLLGEEIKFLFIGGDWHRKGGDSAITIVKTLRSRGIKASLTVISSQVPKGIDHYDFIDIKTFIDRSTTEGNNQYLELFSACHFFIMPTQAEAMGQVFIDAIMTGTPSIALATGGVPEVVIDKKTGLLINSADTLEQFSDDVARLINNPKSYQSYSQACLDLYKQEYSYATWHERMSQVFNTIKDKRLPN